MRFELPACPKGLLAYLPRFLALAGGDRWRKRASQLAAVGLMSPFHAKIVDDYHWLEMDLSHHMVVQERPDQLSPLPVTLTALAAMYFAATVVEVHDRLNAKGKTALSGRLRAALKADTGFAALYLEMEIAQRLLGDGYDIEFPDLEGTAQYDLRFSDGDFSAEVECKSLSVDAGRKIHRKDFYRFLDNIGPELVERASAGQREVIVVTLEDRLPADNNSQSELRAAILEMTLQGSAAQLQGGFFQLEREDFAVRLATAPLDSQSGFHAACKAAFGQNCHVSGAIAEAGICLVVMRSERKDDTSKPWLEAMKKAASQFSGTCPGFIAVQFDDIMTADLLSPHLRERAGILSYALFTHYGASHVAATYFCAFRSLSATENGVGAPAFAVLNPQPKFGSNTQVGRTFFGSIPDHEFAELIGGPLPPEVGRSR
jgi:hypothetical protein